MMRATFELVLFVLPLMMRPVRATTYTLADTWVGKDFLNGWSWWTGDDPTNGRVNYVNQSYALANNLTYASSSKFVMRADYKKTVSSTARGRDSVRISSNSAYGDSLIIIDLAHMPEGLSTWPAFWTISQQGPWPAGGEIDIIEGVNMGTSNQATLHTAAGCTMPSSRKQTGTPTYNNCNVYVNSNDGCGVEFTKAKSYGSTFNNAGGGYYAVSRNAATGISIWFWSRNESGIPAAVTNRSIITTSPTSSWGTPSARFTFGSNCEYSKFFNDHSMIFDLTFCGDWAGAAYEALSCSETCEDYVDNNPSNFAEAYWEINTLRVYSVSA